MTSFVQAALDTDLNNLALAFADSGGPLTITLRCDGCSDQQIDVQTEDDVRQTIAAAMGFEPERVLLGGREVGQGSYALNGIQVRSPHHRDIRRCWRMSDSG